MLNVEGLSFDELSADPSSPEEGDVWYNTTEKKFKCVKDGVVRSFAKLGEVVDSLNQFSGSVTLVAGPNINITSGSGQIAISGTVTNTDEKAKVTSNDTTADYLFGKFVAGPQINLTEANDGGNEKVVISGTFVESVDVDSLNGQTGTVNVIAGPNINVAADNGNVAISASTTTVNTFSGTVTLTAGNDINIVNGNGNIAISSTFVESADVDSLNGLQGALTLNAGPNVIINSGGLSIAVSASVTTINSKSGSVTLTAGPNITINTVGQDVSITGSASGVDEKVKVSANDTTTDYLFNKLVAGPNVTLTETNDGSDEKITITASFNESVDVDSLNGQTGAVNIVAGPNVSVGADNSKVAVSASVTTVNAFSGTVTLTAGSDINIVNSAGNIAISSTFVESVDVDSLNGLQGALTLNSGPNINISSGGTSVAISASVTTVNQFSGSVTLVAGPNISIASGSNQITISGTVTNTDEKVKVTSNDTTSDYLFNKISAGPNINLTEVNNGENESLMISASFIESADVDSLNGLQGPLTLNAGPNINISSGGTSIAVSASVTAINSKSGSVTLTAGPNITINTVGQDISITGSVSGVDEKVKVSSNDTTTDYLFSKLVAGPNVTLTETNDGSNEKITITASFNESVDVDSLNGLQGALTLNAGPNVNISSGGSSIAISASTTTVNQFSGSVTLIAGPNITINSGSGQITITASSDAGDEKVKVSSNDTTTDYLFNKLIAGPNIVLTEANDGGNEKIVITGSSGGGYPFNVLTVDASDPDAQYSSIQAAIDAAPGGFVTTVIHIGPGTYDEFINLKYGIVLIGHSVHDTAIRGLSTANNGIVVNSTSSFSVLKDLRLQLRLNNSDVSGLSGSIIHCSGTNLFLYNCYLELIEDSVGITASRLRNINVTGSSNIEMYNCYSVLGASSFSLPISDNIFIYGNNNFNAFDSYTSVDGGKVFISGTSAAIPNCRFFDCYMHTLNFVTGNLSLLRGTSVERTGSFVQDTDTYSLINRESYSYGLLQTSGRNSLYKLNLRNINGAVNNPQNGNIWYDSSLNKFRARENGTVQNLIGAGGGPEVWAVSGTSTITTTSSSYIQLGEMSITPGAGNYLVTFNTSTENSTNNGTANFSIYVNGSLLADSERPWMRGASQGNIRTQVSITTIAKNVGASQPITAMWNSQGSSTQTVYQRMLSLVKIGTLY